MSSDSKVTRANTSAEIIQAALDACFTVSPSDPQAAAEAYPDIVQALSDYLIHQSEAAESCGPDCEVYIQARAALVKVGRYAWRR